MIKTQRLIMRKPKEADKPFFLKMYRDEDVMRFFPHTLTFEESEKLWEDNERIIQWLTVTLLNKDEFIGYIIFLTTPEKTDFSDNIEIGWMLRKKYWGKGYVPEAAKAALEYGFTHFKQDKIYAHTSHKNIPSIRVMEKLGMEYQYEFNHPKLGDIHPLNPCVLYSITK